MKHDINSSLYVNNLDWSYGKRQILNKICLSIDKAGFYSIIGPNGSGKTTLLKNISRALEPRQESIYVESKDITKYKRREISKLISYVPQNTNIDFDFTAMDIVLMGRSPYFKRFEVEKEEDLQIAEEAMKSTNIWHLRDKNINEISGGERQRVIIARALAQQTKIMLLDEPVSQLDIHHQIELMETIKDLIIKRGIIVIAVLHDLNLAAQYSDMIILLKEGRILSYGSPQTVITKENIESVYGIKVFIMPNPLTSRPHVIPLTSI